MTSDSDTLLELPFETDWLEALIQKEYNTSSEIESYTCKEIGDQKGFISVVTKVDLIYKNVDKEGLPPSLVIKIPTMSKIQDMVDDDSAVAESLSPEMVQRIHNNEVQAYRFLAANKVPNFPMAHCIFLEEMSDKNEGMIILEYVNGRSITMSDYYTEKQIDSMTKHIAAFHAHCTHFDYADVFGPLDECFWSAAVGGLKSSMEKFRREFPEILDFPDESIARAVETLNEKIFKLTSPDKLGYRPVVSFGDSQPNNILFKYNKDGDIGNEVAAFIDFQLFHLGSCVYDVCAMVFHSPHNQEFDVTVNRVLNTYHATFCEVTGNKPILTFEELRMEFLEFYPLYLCMLIPLMAGVKDMKAAAGFSDERLDDFVRSFRPAYQMD